MAFSIPFHPGPRTAKVLRIVGYIVLALVTFVFALQLTFPYDRVKAKIVDALASKYDVTIGEVERGIMPGRMYFKSVTLRSRPAKADDVATTFFISKLEVDLGILALLRGAASVDIDAAIGPGHISGNISISKGETAIDLVGTDLPSGSLPMREAIGLPMSGKIAFGAELVLPNEKNKAGKIAPNWQKAKGEFGFDCPSGCVIGDGKTKLKPKLKNARQQAFAEGGIDFGKISVDTMVARVSIKDGHMELTKFETTSQDGELHVDFDLTLAPVLDDSMVAGCLRFKGSPALDKKEPKTFAALQTTGANIGPDGLFHIRLDGRFKEMKRLAQNCGPAIKSANMDDPGGGTATGNSRPNLTVKPADDSLKTTTPTVNPPPPPPPTPIDAAAPTPTPTPTPTAPPGPGSEHNPNEHGLSGSAGSAEPPPPTPPGEPVP